MTIDTPWIIETWRTRKWMYMTPPQIGDRIIVLRTGARAVVTDVTWRWIDIWCEEWLAGTSIKRGINWLRVWDGSVSIVTWIRQKFATRGNIFPNTVTTTITLQ